MKCDQILLLCVRSIFKVSRRGMGNEASNRESNLALTSNDRHAKPPTLLSTPLHTTPPHPTPISHASSQCPLVPPQNNYSPHLPTLSHYEPETFGTTSKQTLNVSRPQQIGNSTTSQWTCSAANHYFWNRCTAIKS